MLGDGKFNYEIEYILGISHDIEHILKNEFRYGEKTRKQFEDAVTFLQIAHVYAQRIDQLLLGEDEEDDFHNKLAKDIQKFNTKSFRVMDAVDNPDGHLDAPVYEKHIDRVVERGTD